MKQFLKSTLIAAAAAATTAASAAPIVYEGSLTPGVTVGGFINDPSLTGSPNDDFWSFTIGGTARVQVSIIVNRLNAGLDPAIQLYEGIGADTDLLTLIGSADDNYPELPGLDGPFADPRLDMLLAPGNYTVQVWDFASNAQIPGGFCYQITLNGEPNGQQFSCEVPEPAGFGLFGTALVALGGSLAWTRRRRANRG